MIFNGRPTARKVCQFFRLAMPAALALSVFFANIAHAVKSGANRATAIDMIVIHSTGGPFCDQSSRLIWVPGGELKENIRTIEAHPKLGVHYMIDRDGTVVASVPEAQLAHHVLGNSGRSIGIELVNDGDGVEPFPEPQLDALVGLLRDIVQRRGVRKEMVKRHSDLDSSRLKCAPKLRRKVDPGQRFPFDLVLDRVYQIETLRK